MKNIIALLVLLPSAALAAEMYGVVRPPAQDTQIVVICQDQRTVIFADPNSGTYRLFVPQTGRCTLTVISGGRESRPETVFLSTRPVRYDWELRFQDNELRLERK